MNLSNNPGGVYDAEKTLSKRNMAGRAKKKNTKKKVKARKAERRKLKGVV